MNKKTNLRIGTILALSAAFLWAVNIIITKFIIKAGENPINVVCWLTLISTPYWLGLFIRRKDEARQIRKKDWLVLLLIGIISGVLVAFVEIFALKYTQAINFSFLIRSTLVFTITFASLFLGEKITANKVILAVLILYGAYLVATRGRIISLSIGDLLTLVEAALLAFGNTILGKIATKTMSSQLSASGSFLFGFFPVIFFTLITKSFSIPHSLWPIILLSGLGILNATVRFNAYKHCTASFMAMTYTMTPVFVTILAFFLLSEDLTGIQIIGGLLVIAGGVLAEKVKL